MSGLICCQTNIFLVFGISNISMSTYFLCSKAKMEWYHSHFHKYKWSTTFCVLALIHSSHDSGTKICDDNLFVSCNCCNWSVSSSVSMSGQLSAKLSYSIHLKHKILSLFILTLELDLDLDLDLSVNLLLLLSALLGLFEYCLYLDLLLPLPKLLFL